jgi:hypothetical protein
VNTFRRHSFGLLFPTIILAIFALACNQSQTGTSPAENVASPSPAYSPTGTAPDVPQDISGNYSATGTNENGAGEYQADVTVTKRDDVYQFSWTSGGKTYDGVGVKTDNTVAVAFTEGTDGKGCGVVLYKVAGDGSLDGKAGYWGVNSQETEKATRKSGSGFEASYAVTGKNSTGSPYEGTLDVKKDGGGYAFTWKAPETVNGFGMLSGDKAAAGLGGEKCGFVMYQVKPDGMLDGKWGGQGSKSFGTEVAKRK